MERTKQKAKKEKPNKYVDKEKSPSFMADVKTLKENLKIREILRTVKMNSSMRIKAPRGSKVMQNKDFNDNEDMFDGSTSTEGHDLSEPPSATNPLVVNNNAAVNETSENSSDNNEEFSQLSLNESDENVESDIETAVMHKSKSLSEGLEDSVRERDSPPNSPVSPIILPPLESPLLRSRERKLSLDHKMLSKREGLSQSEMDLNLIGKSPLERKSSFFRKKMDSFLKNTTEIFKRQSLGSKSSPSVQRRGSTCSRMSVSMQSLNEDEVYNGNYPEASNQYNEELRGSVTSVRSAVTPARSYSSLSASQSDRLPEQSEDDSVGGSRPTLDGSQPLQTISSTSINNLSEGYNQESFLHSRAISMSSGLDTAHGPRKRKTSRSNRVTWVASESLTDYFRRLIQDEKTREMQNCHSYQDFSTIPENNPYGSPKTDSKGRRLSYQRAVSGEDPVLPTRYQDSSFRRKKIPETPEVNTVEIAATLAEYTRSGIPNVKGYQRQPMPNEALGYLVWAEAEENLEAHYDWKKLSPNDEARQAVIKEFIHTEADYIRHLTNIVEVYIATAHALQSVNLLLALNTSRLFLNIPDVLNANITFWELVMYPMIADSFKNNSVFNTDFMVPGFKRFPEIFDPYEGYVCLQAKAIDYLRLLSTNPEFAAYLNWCNNRNPTRLQLADILVKPMQRLTKYSLIIRRIITYTSNETSSSLLSGMESTVIAYVQRVNRAVRQKEELEKLDAIEKLIEPYEMDFKGRRDEESNTFFNLYKKVNLRTPMIGCDRENSRSLVHQEDMRFRDHTMMKDMDVRVLLFTDILLICIKSMKKGYTTYKMIRPRYMLSRIMPFYKYANRNNPVEIEALVYVVLDEHNTAVSLFTLSEMPKDPHPQQTLKNFDHRIREARTAYELSKWFFLHPVQDLAEIEAEYNSDEFKRDFPDEWLIERRARERVAAMLHPYEKKQDNPDSVSIHSNVSDPGRGPPDLQSPFQLSEDAENGKNSRHSSIQPSGSRNSRLSSFHQSTSVSSHDDPLGILKHMYKTGSSVEHLIPPQHPEDSVRSITVNVIGECDSETSVLSRQPTPPTLVLQQSSPSRSPGPRSISAGGSENTVVSAQHYLVNSNRSLPDLNRDNVHQLSVTPTHMSASEKLYQSHQELLLRNRLAASASSQSQFLRPEHRGLSCPPSSPPRGSLKRGLAFSHSLKNPPLSKMGHVLSQSQIDQPQPSTSQIKVPVQEPEPNTSTGKADKKKQLASSFFNSTGWSSKFEFYTLKYKKFVTIARSKVKSSNGEHDKADKSIPEDEASKESENKKISKGKSDKTGDKVKSSKKSDKDKSD